MFITAVVCTHNPRRDLLDATLAGLQQQSLSTNEWEFLLVDNGSSEPLADAVDLSWHPRGRVIREDRLGLTYARYRSYREAHGAVIVYIDDDNVLASDYLDNAARILEANPKMGAIGGKSLPRYEAEPPVWFASLGINLACRDLGDQTMTASWESVPQNERSYPRCAPVGAGMAIRKEAYRAYVEAAENDPVRSALGRKGEDLASGEDNDMVMSVLAAGWDVGYFPELSLEHIIPESRLSRDYLARHSYSSNKTWVLVLDVHGIRPWPRIPAWTVPLRKARAFVQYRAWSDDAGYIKWKGASGQYEGRALLQV